MAGRPKLADPGTLYSFAHLFYWDFRRLIEGSERWGFDKKRYAERIAEIEVSQITLSPEQVASRNRGLEREVHSGQLRAEAASLVQRKENIDDGLLFVTDDWLRREAHDQARITIKIPGEPQVYEALLRAETPEQIRDICKDSITFIEKEVQGVKRQIPVENWPIQAGSVLPGYLAQYADHFIAAKKDCRFPKATHRPTSQLKQVWFLSRALAGALYGVTTRTAINLVGSKRPEEIFEDARSGKPKRKRWFRK